MTLLRSLLSLSVKHRLRTEGTQLMADYQRAVEQISNPGEFDTRHAEHVCPVIKGYRRRAKAIARFLNRQKYNR